MISPETGNYRLSPGSPARGYGCRTFPAPNFVPPPEPANNPPIFTNIVNNTNSFAGTISQNTLWDADTIYVSGDILVRNNRTLKINPGCTVIFNGYFKLTVNGTLLSEGTYDSMITFTTAQPQNFLADSSHTGCWNGVRFENNPATNDSSKISFCVFEYSKMTDDGYGHQDLKDVSGGALFFNDVSHCTVENSIFRHNVAEWGGAVCCYANSNVSIIGCLIYDNYGIKNAGAFFSNYSYPFLSCNTIADNFEIEVIPDFAIPFYSHISKPDFHGNIVWNNQSGFFEIRYYKLFYTYNNDVRVIENENGNISSQPEFVNQAIGDFRLMAGSSCIDAGIDSAGILTTDFDIYGNIRPAGICYDIGAHEFILPSVVELFITFSDGLPVLNWEPVAGAYEYNIYGADSPDSPFILLNTVNRNSWTDNTGSNIRFYYVTREQ